MTRYPQLIINRNAVRQNLEIIKSQVESAVKIMAVVKADAYGLGAIEMSRILADSGVNYFAVARRYEAEEIVGANLNVPILIFEPLFDLSEIDNRFEYTVSDISVIHNLVKFGIQIAIHLKVNTGMNRIGMSESDLMESLKIVRQNKNIDLRGIYSHMSSSDEIDNDHSKRQLERFTKLYDQLKLENKNCMFHIANSAAIFNYPQSHFNMVRTGIALYGSYPNVDGRLNWNLQPVINLQTQILQVKKVAANDSVGYSAKYKTPRETYIATIQIGYADGFKRILSNNGYVLINKQLCPIVGVVSMDLVTIDCGFKKVKPGDTVDLILPDRNSRLSLEKIAEKCDTIPYEILTSFSKRVQRNYYE